MFTVPRMATSDAFKTIPGSSSIPVASPNDPMRPAAPPTGNMNMATTQPVLSGAHTMMPNAPTPGQAPVAGGAGGNMIPRTMESLQGLGAGQPYRSSW